MMKNMEYINIDKGFIDKYILIDVRSPKEFSSATISGAVNIPLFTDEQRETIGTVYVQESTEKAKKLGVEFASENLPQIYEKISELKKKYKNLVFFCARGGMRSSALVSLVTSLGINAFKLKGGYKGYRAYINHELPVELEGVKFIMLHGNTGVGKTKILKCLEEKGYDILDLEGCANHRGSLLGSVGLGRENSQKQFETLVYDSLKRRKTDIIVVEAESKRIGHIIIPEYIYDKMRKGIHINVVADLDFRVKNIMEDYIYEDNKDLIGAVNKLRRYISETRIDNYIKKIEKNEYESVIEELMVKYYDPMYQNKNYDYAFVIKNENTDEMCKQMALWIDKDLPKYEKNIRLVN